MTGYEDFETRLQQALGRYSDQALGSFDADLIAERAMGATRGASLWRALPIAAILLLLLLATVAGIAIVTQPDPDPPQGPLSTATLRTRTAATAVEYRMPAGMQLTAHQEWSNVMTLTPSSDRGVVIADVTFFSTHDGQFNAPSSGEGFFEVLDRSTLFEVLEEVRTELPNFAATQARVETESGADSHIDLTGTSEVVDFGRPNLTLVAQVDDRAVLIQVWAESEELLAAWLPDARRLIDSLRLSPAAD